MKAIKIILHQKSRISSCNYFLQLLLRKKGLILGLFNVFVMKRLVQVSSLAARIVGVGSMLYVLDLLCIQFQITIYMNYAETDLFVVNVAII